MMSAAAEQKREINEGHDGKNAWILKRSSIDMMLHLYTEQKF
jgi:hypothetical protein